MGLVLVVPSNRLCLLLFFTKPVFYKYCFFAQKFSTATYLIVLYFLPHTVRHLDFFFSSPNAHSVRQSTRWLRQPQWWLNRCEGTSVPQSSERMPTQSAETTEISNAKYGKGKLSGQLCQKLQKSGCIDTFALHSRFFPTRHHCAHRNLHCCQYKVKAATLRPQCFSKL